MPTSRQQTETARRAKELLEEALVLLATLADANGGTDLGDTARNCAEALEHSVQDVDILLHQVGCTHGEAYEQQPGVWVCAQCGADRVALRKAIGAR